jgi:azurin
LNLPVELRTRTGGIEFRFSERLDPVVATNPANYTLEQWTYGWNSSYGSRQGLFSVRNPGQVGPDPVDVRSVRLSADQRSVFLEIPSLVAGPAAGSVPRVESLPDQIQASMGLVMAIEYKLRTAEGAALNQLVHKTIHRVPSTGSSPPVAAAATNPHLSKPGPARASTAAATNRNVPAGGRVVELRSTGIDLAYDVKQIVAKAGETLTIRYINTSDMAHNVVLVKSEADVAPVGNAAVRAYTTDWVPAGEADRIIAATALAEPTEEVSMTFVVPPPGTYPYICTYSGHWTLMRGVLESVE